MTSASIKWPPTKVQQEAMGASWNIPFYNESPMDCLQGEGSPLR
jgi:hypothetical protein